MYDRRLDAIVAAAELGSFSKAAERLNISTTALAKQVASFERELGTTVFERSRQGVSLTEAGSSLVADARQIMSLSAGALRRARELAGERSCVRLGVSLLCPGRKVLDLWPEVRSIDPGLRLELVPIGSIYEPKALVVSSLGSADGVDVIQTSWSEERMRGRCRAMEIGSLPLAITVAQTNPLARLAAIAPSDLMDTRVYVLEHNNAEVDALRSELEKAGVEVVGLNDCDFSTFNDLSQGGDALITSGAWSSVHPALTAVPLAQERLAQCVLLYPNNPSPVVTRFIKAFGQACGATSSSARLTPRATLR